VITSGERKDMSNEQSFEVRNFNDGEWCWINKSVIQEYTSKVGPIGITVYSFLASMADSEQKCFPSQKYIAEKLGCSRATVSRTLKRLESNGLIRIEKRNRYHCAYQLSRVSCSSDETQMSHPGNSDLHQSYTNDNYLIRNINDIDNIKTGEHKKEFTPKTREELLALDLADALNDRKALALYLSYARRFPESLLRKALGEAKEIPTEQIRKSRAALFNHLVRKYVKEYKEYKEYKNHRDQSGN
jgi:biotin operon repressor